MEKKKMGIAIGLIIVTLAAAGGGYYAFQHHQTRHKTSLKTTAYQILDSSVTLPSNVQAWMTEDKKKAGFYTKTSTGETYVLISGGTKSTTGYGIGLEKVNDNGKSIDVEYDVVSPIDPTKVKKQESTPYMVLRFDTSTESITGTYVKQKPITPIKTVSNKPVLPIKQPAPPKAPTPPETATNHAGLTSQPASKVSGSMTGTTNTTS